MTIKTQFLLLSLLSGLFVVSTTYAESFSQIQSNDKSIVFDVQNMTCSICKYTIKKALSFIKGTKKVSVNFEDKTATVIFNPQITNSNALIEAVTNAGYPATIQAARN